MIRLVDPPGDHVLGKARRSLLSGFLTTRQCDTLDAVHRRQDFTFRHALENAERGEDLQGPRDGAQRGRCGTLLFSGTLGLGSRPRLACAGSNAKAHGTRTARQTQGAQGKERTCRADSFAKLTPDRAFVPRSRGEGCLGSASHLGDGFTRCAFLLLRQEG